MSGLLTKTFSGLRASNNHTSIVEMWVPESEVGSGV